MNCRIVPISPPHILGLSSPMVVVVIVLLIGEIIIIIIIGQWIVRANEIVNYAQSGRDFGLDFE